ncbi:A/G-specific adenine glycosylase [Mucisphaera calidilacus]|uniref:Adenine DNA glycosylase n=1 Tax=Mucisphaera calidilacus TaxID=2527982 RepID=A0A518BV73_9BACT|nr:A/G-specific adenine glycosylase [Mucisphaera calidilacus]QDU70847.1 putative A/G-specific adenine glycosylase YfhQ [Mucisphaera calidilacus]
MPTMNRTDGPDPEYKAIARSLIRWHRAHRRDLPWRAAWGEHPDAYRVLVSEVMLQQTQVTTVIPYFERFLSAFPTIVELAEAEPDAVMRLWQGLGYYRRAQRLHACAKAVVERHDGRLPAGYEELLCLPGLGAYTAGAVASIAFGVRVPSVDGNVSRVVSRLTGVESPIDSTVGKREVEGRVLALLPTKRPGMLNESLMELGATVCSPRDPKCLLCPVSRWCVARATGRTAELPVKGRVKDPVRVEHHVLVVERGGRVLARRRGETGLWAGMWELPTLEEDGVTAEVLCDWAEEAFGLRVEVDRVTSFEHRTTHRLITFVVWRARRVAGRLRRASGRWCGDATDLGMAKPMVRVMGALEEQSPRR